MPTERKGNPKASIAVGKWTFDMETRRIKVRTEREVRLSDDGDHGKGTLLRTDKRQTRMTIHDVHLTHMSGDQHHVRICEQGKRATCTKTTVRNRTDIDGKPIADKPESYTLEKAKDLLVRITGLSRETLAECILLPLPEPEEAEELAHA